MQKEDRPLRQAFDIFSSSFNCGAGHFLIPFIFIGYRAVIWGGGAAFFSC